MGDIHDLFQKVCKHPDFAGGTIWTRGDLRNALKREPTEMEMSAAINLTESYLFSGSYLFSWDEVISGAAFMQSTPTAERS